MLTNECRENICFRHYNNKLGLGWHLPPSFLSFNLPLPSLALVLDRDHELVGLVDQVRRRGEHRVGPAKKILINLFLSLGSGDLCGNEIVKFILLNTNLNALCTLSRKAK